MTPQRFEEFVTNTLRDLEEIMSAKNTEYSRSAIDRLSNFKRRAEMSGLSVLDVLQIDLFKHIDAINSYIIRIRNGSPVQLNDPIGRRANDVAIYMILFQALIEDMGLKDQLTVVGRREHEQFSICSSCTSSTACIHEGACRKYECAIKA